MVTKLVLLASLFCVYARAQVAKNFEIKDISRTDCPVSMSGEIQLTENIEGTWLKASYIDHIVSVNRANKAVIAMVVVTDVATSYGPLLKDAKILDSFFVHESELGPGEKHVHSHRSMSGVFSESIGADAKPKAPHAEARVVFVQFADKTIWGNSKDSNVQYLFQTRQLISKMIKQLDAAATLGDEEFVAALATSSGDSNVDNTVLDRIRNYQRKSGSQLAVAKVREMVAVGSWR